MPSPLRVSVTVVGKVPTFNLGQPIVDAVQSAIEPELQAVIEELQVYPPPLENQKYIRTGQLLASWSLLRQATTNGIAWTFRNSAHSTGKSLKYYANWVQGNAQQEQFVDRWTTVNDLVSRIHFREIAQAIINSMIR